jgi:hypothetical protein
VKYIKRPTEPITNDAYSIADAMIRRMDQDIRLTQALRKHGVMSDRVKELSNDIIRLDSLIQDRINKWTETYASSTQGWCMNWWQHLDGYPRATAIDKILAVTA